MIIAILLIPGRDPIPLEEEWREFTQKVRFKGVRTLRDFDDTYIGEVLSHTQVFRHCRGLLRPKEVLYNDHNEIASGLFQTVTPGGYTSLSGIVLVSRVDNSFMTQEEIDEISRCRLSRGKIILCRVVTATPLIIFAGLAIAFPFGVNYLLRSILG